MKRITFETVADNKGRIEIPKKYKSWFDCPVVLDFDEKTETILIRKSDSGHNLDDRRRLCLGRFENTRLVVQEKKNILCVKEWISDY